jgi:CheY-like chemotaxis protein
MSLRCLIVDDNAGFLRSARLLLEGQGITVTAVASNGEDALRQAEALRPDVVLVDIDLGGESGFDVVGRLHRRLERAPSDLILISTHCEEDFADLIAANPVVGFISKPHLSAHAIHRLLDRNGDGAPPTAELRGT